MNPPSIAKPAASCHQQRLEDVRLSMAKADLKIVEESGRQAHGKVLARSIQLAGWSQKEAAAQLGTDESTLSRWLTAKESQQTWRFQQHPILGAALIIAQAEAHDLAKAVTVIEVRLIA